MAIDKQLSKDYKTFLKNVKNRCTNEDNTSDKIIKIVSALNKFFREENLNACTVGISGGIDSAVVLALLQEAKNTVGSPIEKIVPVSLPFKQAKGATEQAEAEDFANLVCKTLTGKDIKVIDLSRAYISLLGTSDIPDDDEYSWANGQMLSVMRTPALYHQAALLQKDGYRSIVVGTINQSEFHLGYWGKTSDMAVDLQPIINLLKFEVYAIAEALGVPQEIINREPKGDVSTGETDLQMMGAPYQFVDMYVHDKVRSEQNIDLDNYKGYVDALNEKQILRNNHKFRIGYPCHFLQY